MSAKATTSTSVANSVTGSPASAWNAVATASTATARGAGAAARRSTAHRSQGIAATDHDRFGKLAVDTIGPETENPIAPSADAYAENRLRKKSQAPSAARGNGDATHKLKPKTSLP